MYVYILRSLSYSNQEYVGSTSDLRNRIREHNRGEQYHTAKFRPWKIKVAIWLDQKEKATNFERYLKSGAGRAFRSKHF